MAESDQLYKRAEEAFQKRSYDYARDLFMQLLIKDLNHAQARKALRATILKKFQEQGAPGKLKLMAIRVPIMGQLKMTKDWSKRIDLCQKHLNEDPGNSDVRTSLAEALTALGHLDGSAAEAEMATEIDPNNITAAKILVAAYIKLKKKKEAQAILEKIQSHTKEDRDLERLQRDLAATLTMEAGFENAENFRDIIKDKDAAAKLEAQQHLIQTEDQLQVVLADLESQLAQNPTDARIPKKIADLIFEKRKDYKASQEWYRKAVQLAPQDSSLKDKVEDCEWRIRDAQIEAAVKANDPRLTEHKVALIKFKIQIFERRVADRPTDMGLRLDLGKAYYLGGPTLAGPNFLDRAIGEFQQSVRDPKKKADSHLFLGRAFQRKKIYDMAEKQYEQAVESVLSQVAKLAIQYDLAKCCAEAKNLPKAIDIGKKIMDIDIAYKDISQLVERWQSGQE